MNQWLRFVSVEMYLKGTLACQLFCLLLALLIELSALGQLLVVISAQRRWRCMHGGTKRMSVEGVKAQNDDL
jgi:hypothetical protein